MRRNSSGHQSIAAFACKLGGNRDRPSTGRDLDLQIPHLALHTNDHVGFLAHVLLVSCCQRVRLQVERAETI